MFKSGLGIAVAVFILYGCESNEQTIVFMDNAKVFEEFEMKKDYDKRMESELAVDANRLDSLGVEIGTFLSNKDSLSAMKIQKEYYVLENSYNQTFETLSSKYTSEVNNRLNEYIKEFSDEKSFDIILGSGGQGNVMFVKDGLNITDELILYINKKYKN